MIRLSSRLSKIVEYVEKEDKILDIGCDHCKLGIFLVENNLIKNMIASDIKTNIIVDIKDKLNYLNLTNKIDLRCGDGLEVITEKDNINTVIISGLGSQKILQILEDLDKHKNINKLIIQTNNNIEETRNKIIKKGFYITNEDIVEENGVYYIVIVFKKGIKKYTKLERLYGPYLLISNNKMYIDYINSLEAKYNRLYKEIPKKYIIKKILIFKHINNLKKVKKTLIK